VKPFGIYTLCLQEKSYVFSIRDKKPFLFKYFNLKRQHTNIVSFQYEIKKHFVITCIYSQYFLYKK
jgi:hypothetical protein